jgi:DNA polymerase, archaea type
MSQIIYSNNKLVKNSAALDLEWIPYYGRYTNYKTKLTAAAFCANEGTRIVLHISQFEKYVNPEKQLILAILNYLDKFDLTFGWYTTGIARYDSNTQEYLDGRDSDFFILDKRCRYHDLPSPVACSQTGKSTFLQNRKHIDLYKVYGKEIIQKGVFNDRYRTLHLEEVSQEILGLGKYTSSNCSEKMTGAEAHLLSVQEQIKYVKRDVELAMMLACHNDCLVLRIMEFIALYAEMDYIITCHTGVTKWYANIYNKMIERDECTTQSSEHKVPKQEIAGGNSIEPKKGFYKNEPIDEFDVKGMYPTIAIEHNVSFETVNCRCCKDNPSSRVSDEVMNEINQRLNEKGLPIRTETYWICQLRNGAFATKLKSLISERELYQQKLKEEILKPKGEQHQELINYYEARQVALKLLANSGYGAFAQKGFSYYDYRVSEIITGLGRLIHKSMEQLGFEKYGFQTVFGFTDSIFVKHNNHMLIPHGPNANMMLVSNDCDNSKKYDYDKNIRHYLDDCQCRLRVRLEHKKRFMFTIIFNKKNRYIAWTGNSADRPILKNLDGMNRRYPKWIKYQIGRVATQLVTKPYDDVLPLIKQAFEDLDHGRFDPKDLQFTEQLDKNPNQYPNGKELRIKVLALELGTGIGEIVYWYESLSNERGYSTKVKDISIKKYKEILWDKIEDILEIAGYEVDDIKSELIEETKIMQHIMS